MGEEIGNGKKVKDRERYLKRKRGELEGELAGEGLREAEIGGRDTTPPPHAHDTAQALLLDALKLPVKPK